MSWRNQHNINLCIFSTACCSSSAPGIIIAILWLKLLRPFRLSNAVTRRCMHLQSFAEKASVTTPVNIDMNHVPFHNFVYWNIYFTVAFKYSKPWRLYVHFWKYSHHMFQAICDISLPWKPFSDDLVCPDLAKKTCKYHNLLEKVMNQNYTVDHRNNILISILNESEMEK